MEAFWNGFEKRAGWSPDMLKKIIKPRSMPKPGPTLNYAAMKSPAATSTVPKWKQNMGA